MSDTLRKEEWEQSYRRKDNYVLYPHEEVIRFMARKVGRRTDFGEGNPPSGSPDRTLIDLGCGIGRHVILASEFGVDPYGIDLSETAVSEARRWANLKGIPKVEDRIVQGDLRKTPWPENTFDFAVSHGVYDSMPYAIAQECMREAHRILKDGAFFYLDLVSGDDDRHGREFAGEEIVETQHEEGTVQSYFNFSKVEQLLLPFFPIREALHIRREDVQKGHCHSRWHVVVEKTTA